VTVQVAVATFVDPAKVALEVVQTVAPALPVTVKTTVPLGVAPLVGPLTVAVKTMLPPKAVTLLFETTLVGVALVTATVSVADDSEL
jgi:hypothetical protein